MRHYVARTIRWDNTTLVNVCDEELLGSKIRGDGFEMTISREYYGDERVDVKQALELISRASVVNLAGNRIVNAVLEAKLASEMAVKKVGDVAFLIIFKFMR